MKTKIIFISIAALLFTITSYVFVDSTTQTNSSGEHFLKNTKNILDDYLKDIPTRTDNQMFEKNIEILHAEIDEKIKQSNITDDIQIQQTIKESNDMFSELDSPEEFIHNVDEQWESSDSDNPDFILYNLINNPASHILRDVVDSDQKSENKFKYAEIFITNSYGVNVAQTEKTSDYLQADEIWWKEARQNGLFVSDSYFDDSAGVHAAEIAISITDDAENFIGVMKIVLNIDSIDQNKMVITSWLDSIFR